MYSFIFLLRAILLLWTVEKELILDAHKNLRGISLSIKVNVLKTFFSCFVRVKRYVSIMYPEFLRLFQTSELNHSCRLKNEITNVFLRIQRINYLNCQYLQNIIHDFQKIQVQYSLYTGSFSFDNLLLATYRHYRDKTSLTVCSCKNFFLALDQYLSEAPFCTCEFYSFMSTLLGYYKSQIFENPNRLCVTMEILAYFCDNHSVFKILDPHFETYPENSASRTNSQLWFFTYSSLQHF